MTGDQSKQIVNMQNPRSNQSAKKYQKSISWCRNKVRELLSKGYDQQQIVSILHVSQPTVSRNITLLYSRQEKKFMTTESYCLKIILTL
jgi:DNA-binding NarL/FixJ family response regulator